MHDFRFLEIALSLGLDSSCIPSYNVYLAKQ